MGRRSHRAICLAVVLAALATVVACRNATEVTLVVTTTVPCSELTAGIGIAVAATPEASERNVAAHYVSATTKDCSPDGTIGTLVITPNDSADPTAGIVVVAGYGGQLTANCTPENRYKSCIVARRNFAFLQHAGSTLPIRLSPDCIDVPCETLSTCSKGHCVSARVECSGGECVDVDATDGGAPDAAPLPDARADAPADGSTELASDAVCNVAPGEGAMAVQDFRLTRQLQRFCIDRTEVTQRDYAAFLQKHLAKVPGCTQPSLEPVKVFDPGTNCTDRAYTPDTTPRLPVVCVDRCDAATYCASVGKRLCAGEEWPVACQSGDDSNDWTFGPPPFDGHKCNGSAFSGTPGPREVGSIPTCVNRGAPYSTTPVFDMTGNVWEHSTGPARGGGFLASENELSCRFAGGVAADYSYEIGFRCCKDAP